MCSSGCLHCNNKLQQFFKRNIFLFIAFFRDSGTSGHSLFFFLISQDLFKLKHFTIIIFLEKVTTFITAALQFLKICSGDVEVCTPFVTQLLHAVRVGCLLTKMYKISERVYTQEKRSPTYLYIHSNREFISLLWPIFGLIV